PEMSSDHRRTRQRVDDEIIGMSAGDPTSFEYFVLLGILPVEEFARALFEIDHQFEGAVGQDVLAIVIGLVIDVMPQPLDVLVQWRAGYMSIDSHGGQVSADPIALSSPQRKELRAYVLTRLSVNGACSLGFPLSNSFQSCVIWSGLSNVMESECMCIS